jgi:MoaA/NifB/PqqE/SkfB family radical SAM enzyme
MSAVAERLAALRRELRLRRQRENLALGAREYEEKRVVLSSTPRRVFLQINAVCNADCVFCSKGYDYPVFSLDDYLKTAGPRLSRVLSNAEELILTGSGEFLGLPDAERILGWFNREYPHVDKYIATNASHARPRVWELIASSQSRYTLQLSLHSSDPEAHAKMMRYGAWEQVQRNIRYLAERRAAGASLRLKLMFIMTTLNAEELPAFVRWAAGVGVDEVVAGYFNIYESQQKYLSLYFKQDLANRSIDAAAAAAKELGVTLRLPPKFGDAPPGYVKPSSCPEPWHQIMVNADGRVLPCDVYGNFDETLEGRSFEEVWNGPAYRAVRRALRTGGGCLETCPRQNATAVNDWRAHVIHRHKDPAQIVKEYHEAMRKP